MLAEGIVGLVDALFESYDILTEGRQPAISQVQEPVQKKGDGNILHFPKTYFLGPNVFSTKGHRLK